MLNALLYVPLHCWLLHVPLRVTAGCVAVCAAALLVATVCRCTAGCYCVLLHCWLLLYVPLRVTAGFAVRTATVTLLLRSTVDRVGVDKQSNKR